MKTFSSQFTLKEIADNEAGFALDIRMEALAEITDQPMYQALELNRHIGSIGS